MSAIEDRAEGQVTDQGEGQAADQAAEGTEGLDVAGLAIRQFDLLDAVISETPVLKRSAVRALALTLVSDLYATQFELLESHGAVPRIEQFYFTHKR
jgi:hypothetical protein